MVIELKRPWKDTDAISSFYIKFGSIKLNSLTVPVWVFKDYIKKEVRTLIKPCPKCGGKAELSNGLVDYVCCVDCGHEGHSFYDGAYLAIKSWNLEAVGRNWRPWRYIASAEEWDKHER